MKAKLTNVELLSITPVEITEHRIDDKPSRQFGKFGFISIETYSDGSRVIILTKSPGRAVKEQLRRDDMHIKL